MVTLLIIIIFLTALSAFVWRIKLHQRKIDKEGWDDMVELRKIILTSTSKEELEDVIEALTVMKKHSFDNPYMVGACNALISLVDEKIELEYPE